MASRPFQPAILAPVPALARYLAFRLNPGVDPRGALSSLAGTVNGLDVLLGIGRTTISRLGVAIEGLHDTPGFEGALEPIPSHPRALWLWLRGDDRGELLHRGDKLSALLEP